MRHALVREPGSDAVSRSLSQMHPGICLIINSFEQPEYLARVLTDVARQTSLPNEVLETGRASGARACKRGLGQRLRACQTSSSRDSEAYTSSQLLKEIRASLPRLLRIQTARAGLASLG